MNEPAATIPTEPELIDIKDFAKIQFRAATVIAAEEIPESKKLIKLQVDLGENGGKRQVLAGLKGMTSPEALIGKQIVIVANLKPAKLMGIESQGMLLAAGDAEPLALVSLDAPVPNGTRVR